MELISLVWEIFFASFRSPRFAEKFCKIFLLPPTLVSYTAVISGRHVTLPAQEGESRSVTTSNNGCVIRDYSTLSENELVRSLPLAHDLSFDATVRLFQAQGLPPDEFYCWQALEKTGVYMVPGRAFDKNGIGNNFYFR